MAIRLFYALFIQLWRSVSKATNGIHQRDADNIMNITFYSFSVIHQHCIHFDILQCELRMVTKTNMKN